MSRPYVDSVTGDSLTLGEHMAWRAQGIFRRWSTMIAIQVVAVVALAFGDANVRNWWNYTWSDLAIVVENVTMLALFAQTRRDAVVMRETREITRRMAEADAKRDLILSHLDQASNQRDVADAKRDLVLSHLDTILAEVKP